MPLSTQALYFHLCMRADDEGFIGNPKKIMRIINAQDDDLKILLSKRFILDMDSGIVVIKHWLIHNTIRMDRFKKTTYQDEKSKLKLAENKAYTEAWQPIGNQSATQVKLSKDKLSKDNINTATDKQLRKDDNIIKIIEKFKDINPSYKRFFSNTTQRDCIKRMLSEFGFDKLISIIEIVEKTNNEKYAPVITTPYQLENNLGKLKAYLVKRQTNNSTIKI